jgi:tetratricopeptide (TPR) repeat protein
VVFQDKEVGEFVNGRFVSLKVNALKGEGKKLREKFKVLGFPTVLLLDSQGEEVDRLCGFDGKKNEYFKVLTDYAEGRNTLVKMLAEVKAEPENIDIIFNLGKKYVSRWERKNGVPYFEKVLQLDPEDEKGYKAESTCQIAVNEARVNNNIEPLLTFMANNPDERFYNLGYSTILRCYKRAKDEEKVIGTYEEALKKMPSDAGWMNDYAKYIFANKIENMYDRAIAVALKSVEGGSNPDGYYNIVQYYVYMKDEDKLAKTLKEAMEKFPNDSRLMNGLGWMIYEKRIKSQYDFGIEITLKALEIRPEAGNVWDTLAWLYYEKSNLSKAIEAMKKAVKFRPQIDNYKQSLKKFLIEKKEK